MADMCSDNRFDIIAEAKKALIEETNIETSEDEMKVIDNFLFRCWQMGWLERYNRTCYAIMEDVRIAAIDYFKYQEQDNKIRLIQHAVSGAEWRWLHKTEPYEAMYPATDSRYPYNPEIGRTYIEALNASAFQYGASIAYETIRRRKKG